VSLQEASGFEVALIGSEGLVGWPALVGVTSSPFRALVRARDGVVLRMPLDAAIATMSCAPGIAGLYNRFVTVLGVQMAESMKACASHRIETRLARWILLRHDRVGGDEILVQHDEIADDLSSRRASITDSLHVIEGTGLVRCRRGRLLVRDRHALENLARGYYGSAEAIYREVIGRFGKGSLASGIGGLAVAQRGLTGEAGAADDGDPCN
jgi:CRP-like cAMP-binding protein